MLSQAYSCIFPLEQQRFLQINFFISYYIGKTALSSNENDNLPYIIINNKC